jgi:hypothetical protein
LRLHKGDINAMLEAGAPPPPPTLRYSRAAAPPPPRARARARARRIGSARQAGRRSRRARTRRRYQIPRGIVRSINPARAAAPHRSSPLPHRSLSTDRMLGCMRLDVHVLDLVGLIDILCT